MQRAFVDLFAGCGGLSLGLERAGFIPALVSELNPDARATYLANRSQRFPWLVEKFNVPNIKDLVSTQALESKKAEFERELGVTDLHLVVGGPPCQGYSGIGHRRSYSVEKTQLPSNHLYQDMAFVIHVLRPRAFLFENVRGLLAARWTSRGKKGEVWRDVLGTFEEIPGYVVRHALVYAKTYGVPQNRPRVFVVGIRRDLGVKPVPGLTADGLLPEPTGGYPSIPEILGDLVDGDFIPGGVTRTYPSECQNKLQASLRTDPQTGEVWGKGCELSEQEYSKHSERVVRRFRHMLANDGEIPASLRTKKFAQRVLPREWPTTGPSITVTSLADDYVHFCQPRSLTVREWARLQTFPDHYRFQGSRTTGGIRRAGNPRDGVYMREVPKYTQIGNAVPVKLARTVGMHLRQIIELGKIPRVRGSQTELRLTAPASVHG